MCEKALENTPRPGIAEAKALADFVTELERASGKSVQSLRTERGGVEIFVCFRDPDGPKTSAKFE